MNKYTLQFRVIMAIGLFLLFLIYFLTGYNNDEFLKQVGPGFANLGPVLHFLDNFGGKNAVLGVLLGGAILFGFLAYNGYKKGES